MEEFIDSRRVRRKSLSLQNFAHLIGSNSSTNNQPQVSHNPVSWADNGEDEKRKTKKEKRNSWKTRSFGNETNSNNSMNSKNVYVYTSEHATTPNVEQQQQQNEETTEREKREKFKKEKRASWKSNVPTILAAVDEATRKNPNPREHEPNDEANFATLAHSPPHETLGADSINLPSDRDNHAPDDQSANTTAATSTTRGLTSLHPVREDAKSGTDSVKFRDEDFLDSQKNTSEKFKKEKRNKRRSMPARLKSTKNDATIEDTSSYSFVAKFSPRNPDRVEVSPHKLEASPRANASNISPTPHKYLSVPHSTTAAPDKNQNQDQKAPRRNAWKRRSMPHHFKK